MIHSTKWMILTNITLKEPDTKGHISYGSIDRKHPKEANPEKQKVD